MSKRLTGQIDCALQCPIPAGTELADVPRPRHDWGGVVHCPQDDCERSFLVLDREAKCTSAGCTSVMRVASHKAGDEQLRAEGWRVYRGTTQGGADLYDVRCPSCSAPDPKTAQAVRALEAGR